MTVSELNVVPRIVIYDVCL